MIGLNLKLLALVTFLSLGGLIWWRIDYLSDQNKQYVDTITQMERDISTLNDSIDTLRQQEVQRQNAEAAAELARTLLNNILKRYEDVTQQINDSKPEEDAAIAPVLRRALDGIGGVQQP